jgi:hypothetical protein
MPLRVMPHALRLPWIDWKIVVSALSLGYR